MINIELWKKRKKELNWSHDDLAREGFFHALDLFTFTAIRGK